MIGILSASSRLKSKLRLHLSQKMRTTITTVIRSYQRHYESNRRICDGFLHEKFINIRHFSGGKSSDEKDVKTSPSTDLAKEEKKASAFVRYSSAVKSTLVSASNLVMNPKKTWNLIVETAQHYWVGSKLLWSEVIITKEILSRLFQGHGMTRRERMQLIRTSTDLFRLVPFAIFVIVPFMEFLLPFALKLFPNMLPSTFQDNLSKEEAMKKELQMRIAVAKFMQDTLQEMAARKSAHAHALSDKKDGSAEDNFGATEVMDFIEKARMGEPIPNEVVIRIAQLFKDELTLANIARPQLVSMCQYMNLPPYGADIFLRFQLRNKLRQLKEDDRRILWEGIDSLTSSELKEACRERGMRSIGITSFKLRSMLQEWLDLSIQKSIPISLLIMSRAFNIAAVDAEPTGKRPRLDKQPPDTSMESLTSSMSSMDPDIINEVVIAIASPVEENTVDFKKRKLESLEFQRDMIEEEREEAVDARKSSARSAAHTSAPKDVAAEKLKATTPSISNPETAAAAEPQQMPTALTTEGTGLSVQEIQAIGDLAMGSSVQREKAEVAILEANMEAVFADAGKEGVAAKVSPEAVTAVQTEKTTTIAVIAAAAPAATESKEPVDKSMKMMKSALNSMLDKLKIKIDITEKALGDKFNLLDLDGDGELTSDELRAAIVSTLKRTSSTQDAEDLIQILDSDKDGKGEILIQIVEYNFIQEMSLVELLDYIENRRDSFEIEELKSKVSVSLRSKSTAEKI